MQSGALKKKDTIRIVTVTRQAEILELTPRQVAHVAEAASHLPENAEAPDYEAFMNKYRLRSAGFFE